MAMSEQQLGALMQVFVHVVSFAFLLVLASTVILTPMLLFLFNLKSEGWQWPDAALFAVMLASTDAVAVSALLKSGESRSASTCTCLCSSGTALLAFIHHLSWAWLLILCQSIKMLQADRTGCWSLCVCRLVDKRRKFTNGQ